MSEHHTLPTVSLSVYTVHIKQQTAASLFTPDPDKGRNSLSNEGNSFHAGMADHPRDIIALLYVSVIQV
jgi:hypothetical protein